ncbi:homoaconitase small subunit [Methanotorris igneus]|uniref:Methanogen homoaconitase small subunit n=1 Tax=Methanotorris igneus (strain DSM 5666 / JCM 11834 / Kol 5) TaxID=880724 RepID=F6BB17_METIK|nr:homoaconitase small subunit [Methanotorris igneus]AEF97104.1 3-isopropylmalate dehydratase small subunit [Methanotorris igneus Kol 5]
MKIRGRAHVFGDDVDTDAIIPGPYLRTTDVYELASHCMAGIDEDFPKKVKEGDVIVAGENFGCGSSREQAPIAIKYCGIKAVIAESFARIFYRNAINIGLIPIVCKGITKHVKDGDVIEVDLENEKIIINDKITLNCETPKGIEREILEAGGLTNYIKKQQNLKKVASN